MDFFIQLSSFNEQEDDEESGYDSDDEESSKLVEKIKNILAEPIEKVESTGSDIKNKVSFQFFSNSISFSFLFRLLLQKMKKMKMIPMKNHYQLLKNSNNI